MKRTGYHPEAKLELNNALARSFDPLAFQTKVEDALDVIKSGLVAYSKFQTTRARQCLLHPLPYSLIYTDEGSEILVIALAHHKRRPGYWKSRLRRS